MLAHHSVPSVISSYHLPLLTSPLLSHPLALSPLRSLPWLQLMTWTQPLVCFAWCS